MALRLGVIGAGLKAADYARAWAAMDNVRIVATAEVSVASSERFADVCEAVGAARPIQHSDAQAMLAAMQGRMDAVYVSTPHAFHAANALSVLEAGYDLLLEKPMVTTVEDALALVEAEKRTGRTVVVAFQGGLSPLVRDTRDRAIRGDFGDLVSVAASIWEGWAKSYSGHWKQNIALSGGGFMFDTGAHMLNTVSILSGGEFERLSAYASNRGLAVDLVTAVAARLSNGALVTFNAAGEGPRGCDSTITLFYSRAIVRIDAWGRWREVTIDGLSEPREEREVQDLPMEVFQAVREGRIANPSTVANGLRFARLWNAIKTSAALDGQPVAPGDGRQVAAG